MALFWDFTNASRERALPENIYSLPYNFKYYTGAGVKLSEQTVLRNALLKQGFIRDVVGARKEFNPVDHFGFTYKPNTGLAARQIQVPNTGASGVKLIEVTPHYVPTQISYQDIFGIHSSGYGFSTSSTQFQNFVNDAFFEVSRGIKGDLTLLQNIVNVFQFGRLVKQVLTLPSRITTLLDTLAKRTGRSVPQLMTMSLRELLALASDVHLAHRFGVLSTIRDVEEFVPSASGVDRSRQWLEKNNGKTVPVYYSKSVVNRFDDHLWYSDNRLLSSPVYIRKFEERIRFTMAAQMKISIPSGRARDLIFAFEGFGLNRFPELAWDLVPFSFVVDYFINVQGWIRNNVTRSATDLVAISGGCSVKSEVTGLLHCYQSDLGLDFLGGEFNLNTYQRRPGLPVSASIRTNFSGLRSSQLAILASLAGQRV